MAWTDTSDTCIAIFGTLGRLKQIDQHVAFAAAGLIAIEDLAFFNAVATPAVNNANAVAEARLIDQMMANGFAATYQTGFDSSKATAALATVLQVGTQTVENLSDIAATIYTI